MHRTRLPLLAAAAIAWCGPASAQSPSAATPPPRYPAVSARLVVPRATLDTRYYPTSVAATGRLFSANPVDVGLQARDAYTAALRRTFAGEPSSGPAVELVVSIASADLDLDRDGWFAAVEHDLVLRDASGSELGRWRVRGQGRVEGVGPSAVPGAFVDAAEYAARTFEADFENPPGVAAWLRANGIEVAAASRTILAPPRLTPTPVPVVRPRSERLAYVDVGGSLVRAPDRLSGSLAVRAGWTRRILAIQVGLDVWPVSFVAQRPDAWGGSSASMMVYAVGVDAALQKRISRRFEILGGAGAHLLAGRATTTYVPLSAPGSSYEGTASSTGGAASLFATARLSGVFPRTAIRYRLGLEARQYFGGSLSFPSFGRALDVADLSVGLFAGAELPW